MKTLTFVSIWTGLCEELPEAENTQERAMQKRRERSSSSGLPCHSGCFHGDTQRTSLIQPAMIILSVGTGAGDNPAVFLGYGSLQSLRQSKQDYHSSNSGGEVFGAACLGLCGHLFPREVLALQSSLSC